MKSRQPHKFVDTLGNGDVSKPQVDWRKGDEVVI
jgi:hypothetical protein